MKKDEIKKILIEEIKSGFYQPGVRLPSESEIAERLGVNKITLNKAVGDLIADGWLRRGTSTRDGTYVQDRSFAAQGSIGIMIPANNSYIDGIVHGIIDTAFQNRWLSHLQIPILSEVCQSEQFLRANHVDGVMPIVIGDYQLNGPGVLIDSLDQSKGKFNKIAADTKTGGREMARLLLEAGHRNIVFILYHNMSFEKLSHSAGFYEGLLQSGIENPGQRFFHLGDNPIELMIRKIMQRFPGMTALACQSDDIAIQAREVMKKLYPEKADRITYSGFGNLSTVQKTFRFLTMDQHPYEIGQRAMEIFLEWKNDGMIRDELIPGTILNQDCIKAP